jgi:hypothetical protein
MLTKALSLSLLLGALVTYAIWYHPPMLIELSVPLSGPLSFDLDPIVPHHFVQSSLDYTMEPGDILVGLEEYGLWDPYPLIEVAGKPVEPIEFGAGDHIRPYVGQFYTARVYHAYAREA